MDNIKIVSTLKNKSQQKTSIHNSSSTVFFALFDPDSNIDTEVSLLNHFLLKRDIKDVVATIEIRNLNGHLIDTLEEQMNEKKENIYSNIDDMLSSSLKSEEE